MKQSYSRPLKLVSVLLLLAMLITSQTFVVFATEATENAASTVSGAEEPVFAPDAEQVIEESAEETKEQAKIEKSEELSETPETEDEAIISKAEDTSDSPVSSPIKLSERGDGMHLVFHGALEDFIGTAASTYTTDSDDDGTVLMTGLEEQHIPVYWGKSEAEQVALDSGSLNYRETLFSIPGINGNDLTLEISYNSAHSGVDEHSYKSKHDYYQYYIDWCETPGYYNFDSGKWEDDEEGEVLDCMFDERYDENAEEQFYEAYYELKSTRYIYYDNDADGVYEYRIKITNVEVYIYEAVIYYDHIRAYTYFDRYHGIGTGWSFNIPTMDKSALTKIVYLPGIGNFGYKNDGENFKILNYPLDDITSTYDETYTANDMTSMYRIDFANGTRYYFSSKGLLISQVDRFGNTISYRYNSDQFPLEIIDTVGRKTSFEYLDTDEGKTVTITAPDGTQTFLYVIKAEETMDNDNNWLLDRIIHADGTEVLFSYDINTMAYSFISKTTGNGKTVDMALLSNVELSTGAVHNYEYTQQKTLIGTKGYQNTPYMTERKTQILKDGNQKIDQVTYAYTVSSNYVKKVVVKNKEDDDYTTYSFNEDHLCTEQNLYDCGVLKYRVSTVYDKYELPNKVTSTSYGTTSFSSVELYTHDKYGNVLTYISPKGGGNASNTVYRTTYTYDDTYYLPLTVSYKKDKNTTVAIENTLTENGDNIASTCTKVNDVVVAKTDFTYDAQGRVITKTEYPDVNSVSGIVTEYAYMGADIISTTIKNVVGNDGVTVDITSSSTYDIMGRPITKTDPNENVTTYTYDVRGRTTSVAAPNGSVTIYAYDLDKNSTTVSTDERETTIYNYNPLGVLETVIYASGDLILETFYDADGRVAVEATGRGSTATNTTYYNYDALDRITAKEIYDADGRLIYCETYEYDDALDSSKSLAIKTIHGDETAPDIVTKTYKNKYGEVVKESIGDISTEYTYDYIGNQISAKTSSIERTEKTEIVVEEDEYGDEIETEVVTIVEEVVEGASSTYTYDHTGNVLTATNSVGDTCTVSYDALGRKTAESDFIGNTISYVYDNAGRLLTMTAPLNDTTNSVTKYYYDANGNVIKTEQTSQAEGEDAKWRTVEQTYDSMNRVTDIITYVSDTEKQYTHYEYNLAGDLTGVYTGMTVPFAMANPDSYSHIAYAYDAHGNNITIVDALGQSESYEYDTIGMLVSATQRDGRVTRYIYDALGNIVSDTLYANAESKVSISKETTAYSLTGAVASVTIDGETVSYTYDQLGNILTETEGDIVKTYLYDIFGRRSGYSLVIGGVEKSTAEYSYDVLDRLVSVTEGGLTTTYTYDANGNRTSQTTGEVTTEYAYNKANLVTDMTNIMVNAEGDSVVISSFAYTYYADGNMHTKSETLLDTTTATEYVYDGAGRLVSETTGDKVISYYYDANNNRTLMNNGGVITSYTYDKNNRLLTEGDTAYTYDANGNTLTAGNKTYNYNARGQQIGYSDGETSAQYAYNPSGLRNAKTVGGSTKYFVYNGMNIVYEYEKNILAGTAYYYGLNRTHNSDGEIYVYNAHGDTVQLVKDNAVVASYTYDAFGNLTSQVGESENPFLYCSEYFDEETETYYLRARYYNPVNGRFTQEDPIGDGLNWYAYCACNPVMYVDPWGLEKIVVSGGSDGAENFKYNFIESAIMQISDWKNIAPEEGITWIIANWNYTEADIANFNTVAETYGVKIMIIENKKALFEYIGREGREDDLITSMSFFAHGTAFEFGPVSNSDYTDQYAVALGYSATLGVPHNNDLNIFAADLENISSDAFAQNSFTFFGSCRTGTELGGAIFAQQWADATRGIVKASTGRTEYYNIFPDERSFTTKIRNMWYKYFSPSKYVKAEREIAREKYGFSATGCKNYPVPVSGYQWAFFRPM